MSARNIGAESVLVFIAVTSLASLGSSSAGMEHTITNNVSAPGFLGEHVADDMAVDIGEPPRRAVIVVGEPLVVEAEEVEDRRVEVVDVDNLLDGLVAELVGGAEAERALDARAGQPGGEPLRIVVTAH